MPNEENEWVNQVVRSLHSTALFVQRNNSDLKATKNVNGTLKLLSQIEILICRTGRTVC